MWMLGVVVRVWCVILVWYCCSYPLAIKEIIAGASTILRTSPTFLLIGVLADSGILGRQCSFWARFSFATLHGEKLVSLFLSHTPRRTYADTMEHLSKWTDVQCVRFQPHDRMPG